MQNRAYQLVLNKIAELWRAGSSYLSLLNVAPMQAKVSLVSPNNAALAFSSEIKSAGHSLQRDLPRFNLLIASEVANSNNDDVSDDATITTNAQPLLDIATLNSQPSSCPAWLRPFCLLLTRAVCRTLCLTSSGIYLRN